MKKKQAYEQIQYKIDIAGTAIKQIDEAYPSYVHKQELIDFYTRVSLYYEFISRPTGSLHELSSKKAQYEDDINASIASLSLFLDPTSSNEGTVLWRELTSKLAEAFTDEKTSCQATQFGLHIIMYIDYTYEEFVILREDEDGKYKNENGENKVRALRDKLYETISMVWNNYIYNDFTGYVFSFELRLNDDFVVMGYINGDLIYDATK